MKILQKKENFQSKTHKIFYQILRQKPKIINLFKLIEDETPKVAPPNTTIKKKNK